MIQEGIYENKIDGTRYDVSFFLKTVITKKSKRKVDMVRCKCIKSATKEGTVLEFPKSDDSFFKSLVKIEEP